MGSKIKLDFEISDAYVDRRLKKYFKEMVNNDSLDSLRKFINLSCKKTNPKNFAKVLKGQIGSLF